MTARALRDGGSRFLSSAGALLRPRALAVLGVLLALLVRWPLFGHESDDYYLHLSNWYRFIEANGDFAALRYDFSNYNTPYLTLLATISFFLPALPDLVAIKIVSVVFDFALAFFVGKCVALRHPDSKAVPVVAGVAVLLLPTVVANSSMWAQAESIYSAFLVAGLYFLLRGKGVRAFAAFGLGFAFKAQAVFLLPALVWLVRKKKVDPRLFPVAGAAYLAALLPAWFAGRPFYDLLTIYADQTRVFGSLSAQFPNLWQIPGDEWHFLWPLGAAATLAVVWWLTRLVDRSRAPLTPGMVVTMTAFSALLLPYLLPKMGSRYFFPAVVLGVVLAFWRPRLWYWPVALELAEWTGYVSVLFRVDIEHTVVLWGGVALLPVVVLAVRSFLRDLGYRQLLREGLVGLRRALRARAAPAAPLLALGGCLAAVFAFALAEGRFSRPVADRAAAATLAQVANLSAEHRFVGFTHREIEPDGASDLDGDFDAAFVLGEDRPLGGGLALRVATSHFGEDQAAQAFAARALLAALWCLSATLAYLSLARLFGRRWTALAATLLAFSGFAGGAWDAVSLDGSAALFALLLLFHGMVVFVSEGRLRQLILKGGAALLLTYSAYALILPFVVLGVFFPNGLPNALPNGRRRAAGDSPEAPVRERGSGNPYLVFGAFALVFGGALFGLNRANERALRATGARLIEEDAVPAATAATGATTGAVGASDSGRERFGRLARVGREIGGEIVPYAASAGREGGRGGTALTLLGVLAALGAVAGAAFSSRRLLLLPLALSGFLLFLVAAPLATGAAAAGAGIPLVLFALGLPALDRFRERRAAGERSGAGSGSGPAAGSRSGSGPESGSGSGRFVPLAVGLSAAVFLASGFRAASVADDPAGAALAERLDADFREIRSHLGRRTRPWVFVPEDLREALGGAEGTARRLVGSALAGPAARGRAEFVLARRKAGTRPPTSPSPESLPPESLKRESLPPESPPPEPLPPESPTPESLPAESLSAESLSAESLPPESPPAESLPAESLPPESPTRESLPPESLPPESPTPESLPAESLPAESLPPESPTPESLPPESPTPESLTPESPPPESPKPDTPKPESPILESLTPGNREVFLYHRAAFDGEVDGMIAAAGPPIRRGEYDIHLDRRALFFVREGCRPEDWAGHFVVHLDPEDARDLPPHRRQFGFENLWFRFPWRALDRGERCVARVPLPDYPIRRLVLARHPGPRYSDWVWHYEFHPGRRGGPVE